jgi:large subunit ribosomal protein L3
MALGLVARKVGMSRVFDDNGEAVPITVFEVTPNRVTQVKTVDSDGYRAVQVTIGERRPSRVSKPLAGHFAKANVLAGRGLWEFRLGADEGADLAAGAELRADVFTVGQSVNVRGRTIGKGFAGTIKRHHFGGGRASHGNSLSHRAPGSIGQRQTPGRVFPGKPMAGQMGNVMRTQQNLRVVRVDAEKNLLLVRGAVPGPRGADVVISPGKKAAKKAK